jgi:hypothetical protein
MTVFSYWFPTAAARFQPRRCHVGFVVDKVAFVQLLSEYFGVPCQLSFHQMPHTHLSSKAGTIGPLMTGLLIGHSFTPPREEVVRLFCVEDIDVSE